MTALSSPVPPLDLAADQPRCSLLGTSGMLFVAPGDLDLAQQRRIWALAELAASWPGIREAVPGITNLMLLFERPPRSPELLEQRLLEAWRSGIEKTVTGRHLDLKVAYGGEGGPHLREVAETLKLSIEEVVERHAAPVYTVYALGSHPGYCYLAGLDPRLFVPRRKVPLLRVPQGSASIAGMQTGVSASSGPSGWHTIGLADVAFFDPDRSPPALLQAGDTIRFLVERIIA